MTEVSNRINLLKQLICSGTNKRPAEPDPATGLIIKNITYDPDAPKTEPVPDERLEQIDENGVPMRWTSDLLFNVDIDTMKGYTVNKDLLDKVKEKLKSEGINADGRTPTHEISDEQLEWLKSRHDFDHLVDCMMEDSEFSNFMLDLAYLNVFSFDEIEDFYGVLPLNANNKCCIVYYHGNPETGEGAGYVNSDGSISETYEEWIDNLNAEYLKTENAERSENEKKNIAAEFASQRIKNMSKISEMFARVFESRKNDMLNNNLMFSGIEDASEKLKEDFGGLYS